MAQKKEMFDFVSLFACMKGDLCYSGPQRKIFMTHDERKLLANLAGQYRQKLKAISLLLEPENSQEERPKQDDFTRPPFGDLTRMDAVKDGIAKLNGEFTFRDVIQTVVSLGHQMPKATVSGVLHRLCKDGKIQVVREGRGRRGAIYKKAQ